MKLKLFRDATDYKQQEVADMLEIERGAYANFESGNREMPFKMEQFFSVSHAAMMVLLVALNLISKQQKENFSALPISRIAYGYGYDMSLYESANEGLILGDYGVIARNLFDSNIISESHYLDLMGSIGIDPLLLKMNKRTKKVLDSDVVILLNRVHSPITVATTSLPLALFLNSHK